MTVTNAAAKVTGNSDTDTRSSTLNLGLDSISLLKRLMRIFHVTSFN